MLKRDGVRRLTSGESGLASELFFNTVWYHKVWIHHGSFLPFNMQENNTAMTPFGEMWFEKHVYRDDFFLAAPDSQYLFMHEMMHVWQYQHGMNVAMRGLFSWAADYTYDLEKKHLSDYSLEQQAGIAADYWLLNKFASGYYDFLIKYRHFEKRSPMLIDKYRNILKGYLL